MGSLRLRVYVTRMSETELKVGVSKNPYERAKALRGVLIFQTDFMHPQLAYDIEYQVKRMLSPYWSRPNDYEIFEVSAGAILNAVQTAIALETVAGRPNKRIEKRPFQWQVWDGALDAPQKQKEAD